MWSGIDWITVVSDSGGFTISMSERQGIAPRGDALENSFGHRVMELRDDAGNARIKLLAATYGDDVTATRIGAGAASFAPSDGCVLLIGGGSGALPAGLGGLAAVPVELDLAGGAVDRAGIPLEMAASAPGRVRVRRAGRSPGLRAVGLSAAPAYEDGGTTVVPLATAGLLEVRVRAARAGVPLGAPLHISGDDELAVAHRGPAVIVARERPVGHRHAAIRPGLEGCRENGWHQGEKGWKLALLEPEVSGGSAGAPQDHGRNAGQGG